MPENIRAEMLREIFFGKWFKILVSERYKFRKLLEQTTQRELREAFMDEPMKLEEIIDSFNDDLKFQVSEDFMREIKTNIWKRNIEEEDDIE